MQSLDNVIKTKSHYIQKTMRHIRDFDNIMREHHKICANLISSEYKSVCDDLYLIHSIDKQNTWKYLMYLLSVFVSICFGRYLWLRKNSSHIRTKIS